MTIPDRITPLSPVPLLETLQEIANHVHLELNGSISHTVHGSVQPDDSDRFQNLPPILQQRFLSLQLRNFLYDIYFSGSRTQSSKEPEAPPIENNRAWGLNLDFFTALHESNQGQGFGDPDWIVTGHDDDGLIAVQKQELTLHLIPEQHLAQPPARGFADTARVGEPVTVKMPRNRLQNGCYIAIGNAGLVDLEDSEQRVHLFFNLKAEGAAAVMQEITTQLNAIGIPFTFRLPYDPSDYDRWDTATLCLNKPDYPQVRPALSALYALERAHFRPEIPFCTKLLASGIALAEEPDSKFSAQETFGTHRCQLIANGLLAAHQRNESAPEFRLIAILNQFYAAALELEYAHLNAGSEDIYLHIREK
jgi:HopA1 effector protein family